MNQKKVGVGIPLVVQWLRLHSPNAENSGSIPPGLVAQPKKKKKEVKTKAEVAALIYNIADFGARNL